jgi:hypothetical protein
LNNNDGLISQALIEAAYESLKREMNVSVLGSENLVLSAARG